MELTVHKMIRFEKFIKCHTSSSKSSTPCCFYSLLVACFVAVEYVYAVRLVCSQFQECLIEDMYFTQDVFMHQYIPGHAQSLRYRNLVVAKVDSEFFRTVPAHITILHISQSFILKSISVPGRTNLSELILSDLNELHKLEIDETNTITELSVTVSKLATIPQSIGNLKAAHKITFTNCPIEVLNLEMFCDLSKLRVLNFNENRIHRLLNSATKRCTLYNSLQMFSISRNLIKQFHLDLFNPFGSLQQLDVIHNGMVSLRDGFNSVAYLSLALTKNKLKTLDLCRWNVPNMIILKLDYNNLTTIPTCLKSLVNVTVLNLAHNQVTHATIQNFAQMKRLRELVLSSNNLATFTLNSSEYPASLEALQLESNNLTELDLSLVPGPLLQVYVKENCISRVDMERISPNVTKLFMWPNPTDCSWQTVEQRNNLTCVENASIKQSCT